MSDYQENTPAQKTEARTARNKTILDIQKLSLGGTNSEGKKVYFRWRIFGNHPSVICFHEVEGKIKSHIRVGMDLQTLYQLFQVVDEVIDHKLTPEETKGWGMNLKCFLPNPDTKEREHSGNLQIGKDGSGRFFFVLSNPEIETVRFYADQTDGATYHQWLDMDGQPISAARLSILNAKGLRELLSKLYAQLAASEFDQNAPGATNAPAGDTDAPVKSNSNWKNNNGGGGYNRGNGGGQWQNKNNGGGYNKGGNGNWQNRNNGNGGGYNKGGNGNWQNRNGGGNGGGQWQNRNNGGGNNNWKNNGGGNNGGQRWNNQPNEEIEADTGQDDMPF